ncbi:MAG: helix-turn-helix domain-containing protein, partial [Muribaculaceae bacterium]|nr:helix-turn-helix domain-containing protein [Muribaculaceae bacterium]
ASDLKPVIDELDEMRSTVETLKEISQPMFQGRHYLTDSALCRRLNICKRTLAIYRANGVLGYYNLPGKILYSDSDVEAFLQRHYLPPFH